MDLLIVGLLLLLALYALFKPGRTGTSPVQAPGSPPRTRSSDPSADLTDWERDFITRSRGKCPDCERGTLLKGLRGGLAFNVLCEGCGSTFNVMPDPFSGDVLFGHRLGPVSSNKAA